MIFLITNNAKVTLMRSATHMVPLNFVPPKKKKTGKCISAVFKD